MHDDFVLQGHPVIFIFAFNGKESDYYWGAITGAKPLWKFCHNSQHAAQPASEWQGKRPPEKRHSECIFQNILMYRREEKKKYKLKEKEAEMSNQPQAGS